MSSIINTSRIAIVGLGQLGGSLVKRIHEISCTGLYAVSRNKASIQELIDQEIIDAASTDAEDVLPVADITFICLPLTASVEFVRENLKHFRPGSIVTDVGSVKGAIVRDLRGMLVENGVYFIGGHPMAGSEKSGLANSRSDLYKDTIVFLTPTPEDEPMAIDLLRDFWRDIGACPIEVGADVHDKALSRCSHVLHLMAASAVKLVLESGDTETQRIACAGGFRDLTRIAMSDPEMWTDIARCNQEQVAEALGALQAEIGNVQTMLANNNWEAISTYLKSAKALREDWQNSKY